MEQQYIESFGLLQFEEGIKLVAPVGIQVSEGLIAHALPTAYSDEKNFESTLYLRRTRSLGFPYTIEIFPPSEDNEIKIGIPFENISNVDFQEKPRSIKINYREKSVTLKFLHKHDFSYILNYLNMLQIWNCKSAVLPFVGSMPNLQDKNISLLSPVSPSKSNKGRFFGISQSGTKKNHTEFTTKNIGSWTVSDFFEYLKLIPFQEFYEDYIHEKKATSETNNNELNKVKLSPNKQKSEKERTSSNQSKSSEIKEEVEGEEEEDHTNDDQNFTLEYMSLYFNISEKSKIELSPTFDPPWKKNELFLGFRIISTFDKLSRSHKKALIALSDFFNDSLITGTDMNPSKPVSLYLEFQKNARGKKVSIHLKKNFFEYLANSDISILHRIFTHLEFINIYWDKKMNIHWYRIFAKVLDHEMKHLYEKLREKAEKVEKKKTTTDDDDDNKLLPKEEKKKIKKSKSILDISKKNKEEEEIEKKKKEEEEEGNISIKNGNININNNNKKKKKMEFNVREIFDLFTIERKMFFLRRQVWDFEELVNQIMLILITGEDEVMFQERIKQKLRKFNSGDIDGILTTSEFGNKCVKYKYRPREFLVFLKQVNKKKKFCGVKIENLEFRSFYMKYINEKFRIPIENKRREFTKISDVLTTQKLKKEKISKLISQLDEKCRKIGECKSTSSVRIAVEKLRIQESQMFQTIKKYEIADLPYLRNTISTIEKELYDLECSRSRQLEIFFDKFLKPKFHEKGKHFETYIKKIYSKVLEQAIIENPSLRYTSTNNNNNNNIRRNNKKKKFGISGGILGKEEEEEEEENRKEKGEKKDLLEMKLKFVIARNTRLKPTKSNRILRIGANALDKLSLTESYKFGLFHSYIQVKNLQLHFFDNSLIYCGELTRMKNLSALKDLQEIVCLDLDSSLVCNFQTLRNFVRIIAKEVVFWNSTVLYTQFSVPLFQKSSKQKKNCQEFVKHFLKIFHCCPFYDETNEYLDEIKNTINIEKQEKNIRFLKINSNFLEKFKIIVEKKKYQFNVNDKKIFFISHQEIDDFIVDCFSIDPAFDRNYGGYYQILKGFDRAYWMRLNSTKEKNSEFLQPSSRGCAFSWKKKK